MLISVGETGKHRLQPGQEGVGYDPVLSHFTFLRNYLPKSAGVLEHCPDEQTTYFFLIFGAIPCDQIHKATKDVLYRNISHAANTVY
jgi:hypothetical protein